MSWNSLRPLGDRVLVRRAPEESVSEGGILIPDQAKTKPQRGEVLKLGRWRMLKHAEAADDGAEFQDVVEFQVAVGDTVYFNRYGGIEVEVQGEKLLLMSETEILAYTRP